MNRHLESSELLEIVYLDGTSEERSAHLQTCTVCRDQLAVLAAEIEQDRSSFSSRISSKPEQFWNEQRSAIVARATARDRSRFLFLRFRPTLSIIMAALLLVVGIVAIRSTAPDADASIPVDAGVTVTATTDLFEEDELRALDPWETDQLESFRQIVEWEEWLDEDIVSPENQEES